MRAGAYLPVIIVVVAAGVWGLFWLPLRAFERAGLAAGWATLAQFVVPAVVLLPVACVRALRRRPTGLRQWLTGAVVGTAFVLYYESLLLTEVVRALILFYVTPAWGTLLEVVVLRRRVTVVRVIALLLGFTGLLTILGLGDGPPLPRNLGDGMALLSGLVFALGSLRVRRSPGTSVFEQSFAFFVYGGLVALALALLPLEAMGAPPSPDALVRLLPWLLLMAVAFLIPVMWGLLWGARHLDPGRLGILLQTEAIIGIGSAALLAGEPFGVRELAGSILVVAAGTVEVLGQRRTAVQRVDP